MPKASKTAVPDTRSVSARWIHGFLLAGLLVVAYVTLLRPARGWIAEAAMVPTVAYVASTDCSASAVALGVSVRCTAPSNLTRSMRAPGGILFIIPATLLALLFPARPYWLWLGGYVAALGGLAFLAFCIGAAWTPVGFTITEFLQGHIRMATCLGSPMIAVWWSRPRTSSNNQEL